MVNCEWEYDSEIAVVKLLAQIFKILFLANVRLNWPSMHKLCANEETMECVASLPAHAILLRWVNFHLQAAGSTRHVSNFRSDFKVGRQ